MSEESSTVVDSILNRMTSSYDEEKIRRKLLERMEQDRTSWLNAVKRRVKDCHNGGSNTVPLSCFRYLWDLGQGHGRVAVRRASLNLCGILLDKSSECRMFVSADETLFKWVTCVVEAKNVTSEAQVPCWQAEALEWLKHLSETYGDLYPKFRVAQQFLQQRCTASMDSVLTEGNSGATMPDLRRLRDIVMKYGGREIAKVDKLIQRAHKSLDVLVPRMSVAVDCGEVASVPRGTTETVDEENNSDDDDIDWEDGDEVFDEATVEDHAEAVERTLAAMASAGGLQGGAMEINLELKEDDDEKPNAMDENAHKLLQKMVKLIETRHMKRLSSWVDALIKSDELILNEKSLVLMSADVAKKRGDLLQKLLDRKQALANILASAAKLGVCVDSSISVAPSNTLRPAAMSNIPPARQSAILATAARHRYDSKVSRRRSTKLQIKYRTS